MQHIIQFTHQQKIIIIIIRVLKKTWKLCRYFVPDFWVLQKFFAIFCKNLRPREKKRNWEREGEGWLGKNAPKSRQCAKCNPLSAHPNLPTLYTCLLLPPSPSFSSSVSLPLSSLPPCYHFNHSNMAHSKKFTQCTVNCVLIQLCPSYRLPTAVPPHTDTHTHIATHWHTHRQLRN